MPISVTVTVASGASPGRCCQLQRLAGLWIFIVCGAFAETAARIAHRFANKSSQGAIALPRRMRHVAAAGFVLAA